MDDEFDPLKPPDKIGVTRIMYVNNSITMGEVALAAFIGASCFYLITLWMNKES